MTYSATSWDSDTLISARFLRHAEEQYAEAKDYLDAHIHDDRYYTETEADVKFFHLDGGDTLPAGLDADTIDGSHATDLIGSALPVGTIMVWYGTDANVPSLWAICNGGGTTPDLRDKFIVGAGSTYAVGNTGGVTSVTPGAGAVTVAGHELVTNEIPSHRHSHNDYYGYDHVYEFTQSGGAQSAYASYTYRSNNTETYGTGVDAHDHTDGDGSYVTITSENIDNRPPYYALYYIQKVS